VGCNTAHRIPRLPILARASAGRGGQNFFICVIDAQYKTDRLPGFDDFVGR
jgi:hypothetical protein